MKIEFSEHFWKRFEERRRTAPVNSREWRIKKIEGYCFKIIVEHVQDGILVLTLFFDRGLRRKGLCE